MPRQCGPCLHPERQAIDSALVAGEPYRNIAERFGTSTTALHRHKGEHLPVTLTLAHDAAEVANADDLLGQVRHLQTRALAILDRAEADGQLMPAPAAIRECRGCLELLGKLMGELSDAP